MRILPYPRKFFGAREQNDARDWSQQELADFYRAHRLLVQNGVGIGLDRGLTDAGDPWMAFFDVSTQDVFMHVARIDGKCLLICDQLNLRITCNTISELIATFESEVCRIVSVRQQKSGNVILHPAARIIMSISAVFLLFKLENSVSAHAKSGDVEFGAGHDASSRKQEVSVTGRAQTVLARLYDMVDSPAAVASLAGVLLSLEIANINSRSNAAEHAEMKLPGTLDGHDGAVLFADASVDAASDEAPVENGPIISESHESGRGMVVVPIPVEMTEVKVASANSSDDNVIVFTTVERTDIPMLDNGDDSIVVPAAAQSAPISADDAKTDDTTLEAKDTLAFHALQAIMDVTSLDFEKVSDGADGDAGVGEITLSMLESLVPSFGAWEKVELSDQALIDALVYFRSAFAGFEFEVSGSYFLMEQSNTSSLKHEEIGLWQNVMGDGSEILIIGHVDLIEAAEAHFA
ncbi:hypothetical protein [Mesorhizobium sp. CAU 1741]|uniref:hypothetical protein n=1 Tax=Mesorhizobium sp. CAU 1741 TaxID=3140366 RepID=UPI00325AF2C4